MTGKVRASKTEQHLSDYIKRHLERDLQGRGIIANREVEIRKGERIDIRVDAVASGNGSATLTVIVEVKGCWNPGREKDLTGQLQERYLFRNRCRHGLYVVGWFSCPAWDTADRRKHKGPKTTVSAARHIYEQLAKSASVGGVTIRSIVLDLGLH